MDRNSYLLLHIPGRGRLTLSLPGGVERAIRNERLPGDTEALLEPEGVWLPLKQHPAVESLLARDPEPELGPLVLISLEASPVPLRQVRPLTGVRPSTPAKVIVAGGRSNRSGWLASLSSIERWATSLAILLATTGLFSRSE